MSIFSLSSSYHYSPIADEAPNESPVYPSSLSLFNCHHVLFNWVHSLILNHEKLSIPTCFLSEQVLREYKLCEIEARKHYHHQDCSNVTWLAIYHLIKTEYLLAGWYLLLNTALLVINTISIKFIVEEVHEKRQQRVLLWSFFILIMSLLQAIFLQHFIHGVFTQASRVVSALTSRLLYACLSMKLHQIEPHRSIGEVQNIHGKDIASLRDFIVFAHNLWANHLLIIVSIALLVYLLGPIPAITSALLFILLLPIESWLSKLIKSNRKKYLKISDKRMSLVHDLISGIRTIKLSNLVTFIRGKIESIRYEELSALWDGFCIDIANSVVAQSATLIVTLITFLTYGQLHKQALSPGHAFTALALISALARPIKVLPKCVSMYQDAVVSIKRISDIIQAADAFTSSNTYTSDSIYQSQQSSCALEYLDSTVSPSISLINATAVRPPSIEVIVNSSFSINKSGLYILTGMNGAGKTSLLLTLLGELKLISGEIDISPSDASIGYCAHDSWIVNASVRDNILLGNQEIIFNAELYDYAMKSCALTIDVSYWKDGDLTLIGERGMNVSGGQRARIALARALYSEARILLLDNIFSGLDETTSLSVFKAMTFESKKKLIILSSHSSFHASCSNGIIDVKDRAATLTANIPSIESISNLAIAYGNGNHEPYIDQSIAVANESISRKKYFLTDVNAYLEYFKACKLRLLIALLLSLAAFITVACANYVVAGWTDGKYSLPDYIEYYSTIALMVVLFHILRQICYATAGIQASNSIHNNLLANILGASISFFTDTPSGTITSRFSSDLSVVDADLVGAIAGVFDALLSIVTSIAVVTFTFPPYFLFLAPIVWQYYSIHSAYRSISKTLKKEDAAAKGPLYSHFYEILSGLEVIRGYKIESKVIHRHHELLDTQIKARLNWDAVNRWLGIQLDLVGVAIVFAAVFCLSFANISGGLAGLTIAYAMQTTLHLSLFVRSSTALENTFVSPERVFELITVEQEYDPCKSADFSPHPTQNRIILGVENLTCRYNTDTNPVLNDISFELESSKLTGICGRTGSGKSSIALALTRSIDNMTGSIKIDNVNIFDIPLSAYRKLVQVFPQDTYILSGTIREYLNPFNVYSDFKINEILNSLTRVVREDIESEAQVAISLDFAMKSGGENLSAGQKQILALARAALVTEARIVILDEITSNMDKYIAKRAMQIIKDELLLKGIAVMLIAHAVDDLLTCDNIWVISNGQIIERKTSEEYRQSGFSASIIF